MALGKRSGSAKRSSSKRGPARRKKTMPEWTEAEREKMADIFAPCMGRYIDLAPPMLWCSWWVRMKEGAEKQRLEAFLFPDGILRQDFGDQEVRKALKQMCRESLELFNVIGEDFFEGVQKEFRKDRRSKKACK
jgi:hypothetical protein